jgi:hypothetical protein
MYACGFAGTQINCSEYKIRTGLIIKSYRLRNNFCCGGGGQFNLKQFLGPEETLLNSCYLPKQKTNRKLLKFYIP